MKIEGEKSKRFQLYWLCADGKPFEPEAEFETLEELDAHSGGSTGDTKSASTKTS